MRSRSQRCPNLALCTRKRNERPFPSRACLITTGIDSIASGHRSRWARHRAQSVLPKPAIGAGRLDRAATSAHSSPPGKTQAPRTVIIAKSSESFEFVIDERRHPWPEKLIARDVLILLAGQEPSKFSVWQELRHSPTDKEILDGHPADLAEPGLERFYTVMTHTTEGNL